MLLVDLRRDGAIGMPEPVLGGALTRNDGGGGGIIEYTGGGGGGGMVVS
jgi:hypothetical protein